MANGDTPLLPPLPSEEDQRKENLQTYHWILDALQHNQTWERYVSAPKESWIFRLLKSKPKIREVPWIAMKVCWVASRPGGLASPNPQVYEVGFVRSNPVSCIRYAVSPLLDCVYVFSIFVEDEWQRKGYGISTLLAISEKYGLPIVPIHVIGSASHFWTAAATWDTERLVILKDVRSTEIETEMHRFSHLCIPHVRYYQLRCCSTPNVKLMREFSQGNPECDHSKLYMATPLDGSPTDKQDFPCSPQN